MAFSNFHEGLGTQAPILGQSQTFQVGTYMYVILNIPPSGGKTFPDILTEFEDNIPMCVLKHCTTRWLSLKCAVNCLLSLWPALHTYFDREAEVGNTHTYM